MTYYNINKKPAKKFLKNKINWHIDVNIWFYNLNIYNNDITVFYQIWDNKTSNNTYIEKYDILSTINIPVLNFRVFRIGNIEFSVKYLILFFLIIVYYKFYLIKKDLKILFH
jgi:hypothetical protein